MNEKVLKCLYDIKLAIEEIESFFIDIEKSYDSYKNDILLRRAIEGEAMSRILKEDPVYEIVNARRIIGLRNQIIHGYDSVSDENIWGIVMNHLPNLKIEVDRLVKE